MKYISVDEDLRLRTELKEIWPNWKEKKRNKCNYIIIKWLKINGLRFVESLSLGTTKSKREGISFVHKNQIHCTYTFKWEWMNTYTYSGPFLFVSVVTIWIHLKKGRINCETTLNNDYVIHNITPKQPNVLVLTTNSNVPK